MSVRHHFDLSPPPPLTSIRFTGDNAIIAKKKKMMMLSRFVGHCLTPAIQGNNCKQLLEAEKRAILTSVAEIIFSHDKKEEEVEWLCLRKRRGSDFSSFNNHVRVIGHRRKAWRMSVNSIHAEDEFNRHAIRRSNIGPSAFVFLMMNKNKMYIKYCTNALILSNNTGGLVVSRL